MQCLNFIWEVVSAPLLQAEGISGLLQRTSDSSLISFYCLHFVWSILCTYNIVFVQKDTCQHRDQTFPSPQGPHSHSPQFLFYFESPKSSEMVAARISIIQFCVVPINLFCRNQREMPDFCELYYKYKLFKEILRCNQCTTF